MADQPAATGVAGVTGGGGALLGPARIQILRSPGCPLAGRLRGLVEWCVARSGVSATVEEIEGPYPSPTLLINGADVSGRRAEVAPSCRLDVPGAGQILAALQIRDRVPDEGGWYLARRTNVVGPKRSSQDSTLGVPLA